MSEAMVKNIVAAAERSIGKIIGKNVAITYCVIDASQLSQQDEKEMLNPYDFALLCCKAMGLSTGTLKNERFALLAAVVAMRTKYKEVATWKVIKEALKLDLTTDAINAHIDGLTSQRQRLPTFTFYYNKLKPLLQ